MAALRAVFVLMSISCIGAFHPLHDFFKRQVPPQDAFNPFKNVFKREQPGLQAPLPCATVTADLMTLIDYQSSPFPFPFSITDFVTFTTSVDARNSSAVNQVVCHFLSVIEETLMPSDIPIPDVNDLHIPERGTPVMYALSHLERQLAQDVNDIDSHPGRAHYIRNQQLTVKLLRSLEAAGAM
ncbi:hypothetical protein CAPTEDRAFT_202876 [Capitella teleta]|uniref:Uncharacterized protein n=1 Tax=Capitella teleta TaxID=283909 RepID=R7UIU9_CAPTE|nr:hypothetical protein CAPTEDRAFT_202876 [Capitella teleta]|eukprot:ELU06090.1 hypothetical protein CAPTEDRAFT_202876 [Capitella teleta]